MVYSSVDVVCHLVSKAGKRTLNEIYFKDVDYKKLKPDDDVFNKPQAIFVVLCMMALWLLVANFLSYFLNGVTLRDILSEWDLFKIVEIIVYDYVPATIKQKGTKP